MTLWKIFSYDTVDSTNEVLKRLVLEDKDFASEGFVCTAKEQTKGKGRRGRVWESTVGNLYASLAIRIKEISELKFYSFLTAIALAEALETFFLDVKLKWPNDVLIKGAKVSGILLETEGKSKPEWLIIGTGVNIASAPDSLGTLYKTTSLHQHGLEVTPQQIFDLYFSRFKAWNDQFNPPEIIKAWKKRAYGVGQEITVNLSDKALHGTFLDLDAEGSLLLENNDGIHAISAGDVFFSL